MNWLSLPEKHAISIIKEDHDKVKELFERFEKTESEAQKDKIIAAAVTELKIHAEIEEEIFYPAVRHQVDSELMNEADEDHHVARLLIAELDSIGRQDEHRHAKFAVLAESVRQHIKEEESKMLPEAKKADIDFEQLGQQILDRKKELKTEGIPPDAEHAMVAKALGNADSPAQASRRSASSVRKATKKTTRPAARKGAGASHSGAGH
jgi:hypothetical protein